MSVTIQTEIPCHRPTSGFETHPEEPLLVENEHAFGDEGEIGGSAIDDDFADQDTGIVSTGFHPANEKTNKKQKKKQKKKKKKKE
ncbi:hypothetical protein KC345_g10722 [Hortaea werneckii]|nr:hypothetical protein KC345_g10722 [Hortaea werneckii]